jgi:hypothetical protein
MRFCPRSWIILGLQASGFGCADLAPLRQALTFYSSFDHGVDADYAAGDPRLHTAPSLNRIAEGRPGLGRDDVKVENGAGRFGAALRFERNSAPILFYRAEKNIAYDAGDWSGTVSLWLSLDPDADLLPDHYSDPFQMTDKAWDNAAIFVDFSKDERPRHFRLGVFADTAVWNPQKRKWDEIPEADRPMVTVKTPPFGRGRWTHVAFTFKGFNRAGGAASAAMYLDGKKVGDLAGRPQAFTWDPAKATMMIGITYLGLFDELAVFDRALSDDEVERLYGLRRGVRDLIDADS